MPRKSIAGNPEPSLLKAKFGEFTSTAEKATIILSIGFHIAPTDIVGESAELFWLRGSSGGKSKELFIIPSPNPPNNRFPNTCP